MAIIDLFIAIVCFGGGFAVCWFYRAKVEAGVVAVNAGVVTAKADVAAAKTTISAVVTDIKKA
jgi:hypothetical protein